KRMASLVNWKIITTPKEFGGLDIQDMQKANVVFLSKLGWRMMMQDNSLW
ncbi:conserved hypothetical protein, partial [Ricinus communis]